MEKSPRHNKVDPQQPSLSHSSTPSSSSSISYHNPNPNPRVVNSMSDGRGVTFLNSATIPITRSDPNNHPYPTTFVQADTNSFKQVVQMLTGSSQTAKLASQSKPTSPLSSATDPNSQLPPYHSTKSCIPPIRPVSKSKPSRLYERRNSFTGSLRGINPVIPTHHNISSSSEILSPSLLDFPGLVLSPVTPLIPDPFNRSPGSVGVPSSNSNNSELAEEEKAIADKGFYLHRSPSTTPTDSSPRLLPLFPVTSPKVSGSD